MPAADRTLQLIADTLTATEAPMPSPDTDRIPLRTAELSTAAQLAQARADTHALEVERDDLRIQLHREQADGRAMMRDRDAALGERNQARQERDTLAARLEHAETARIDADGDLWRPAPNARWTLSGDRKVILDEDVMEHLHGPTRPVLIIDNGPQDDEDEPEPAPSPGSGPTRAQDSPAGYEVVVTALHRDGVGALQSGDVAVSAVVDPADGSTAAEALAQVLRALGAPEPIRPADWEQRAITAARDVLVDAWPHLAAAPVHTARLATVAVRAIIDAGLAPATNPANTREG